MCFALASPICAQVDPLSGIDFVTIGAPGNAPWPGNGVPNDRAVGRGGVGYEYKIGRYEVTTSQWVEFMNAAFDRPLSDRIPHITAPLWGATSTTPNTPGGLRWTVPAGNEMRMVGGLSWRSVAVYCNWLHNGKSLERSAFLSGAYDVSTFGPGEPFGFTDQLTRSPGAKYFIPTWDEWLKAVHYDPNKPNPGGSAGGWWQYANMRDTPLTYGPPPSFGGDGTGMANSVFTLPGFAEFLIPIGSYPTQVSPWGLLDTAGGMSEWNEGVSGPSPVFPPEVRLFDGSAFGMIDGSAGDRVAFRGGEFPSIGLSFFGFRVAAAVPGPGVATLVLLAAMAAARRRR